MSRHNGLLKRGWRDGLVVLAVVWALLGPVPGASATPNTSPAPNTWSFTGFMAAARTDHTATLLRSGKVLVAGGCCSLASAELYDPTTSTWTATGSMHVARYYHTATLLPNGKVLVAGGCCDKLNNVYSSAELYDPASGTWTLTGSMTSPRGAHSATLLRSGMVLVAGGCADPGCNNPLSSAELYDPASGTWTATGSMSTVRSYHTATLLSGGKVLVVGGCTYASCVAGDTLASAELYDPASGTWATTGSLPAPLAGNTATLLQNGNVLIAGGFIPTTPTLQAVRGAELYSPATGTWTATGNLITARYGHSATLLPNGWVLVAGGLPSSFGSMAMPNAELYDPTLGRWTATGPLVQARSFFTATLLPNGTVLAAGGTVGCCALSSAELYTPGAGPLLNLNPFTLALGNQPVGTTGATRAITLTNVGSGPLQVSSVVTTGVAAADFALTTACTRAPIPPGGSCTVRVTFTPGAYGSRSAAVSIRANDPAIIHSVPLSGYGTLAGGWAPTGPLIVGLTEHTATLLPDGQVLAAGGAGPCFPCVSAVPQLYDPATQTWTLTGAMITSRDLHTATLLRSGKVLAAGGCCFSTAPFTPFVSAELYDPATGTWTATGSMANARFAHTATLLPNGKVLVAGGLGSSASPLASAELYDPSAGTWATTGSMTTARQYHTATLLQNGSVLVTGGWDSSGNFLTSAELYDPATGTWAATGSMAAGRVFHTATRLPNGTVLVAGGADQSGTMLAGAELYHPSTGTWTVTGSMATARAFHTATLLRQGQVLVAGGCTTGASDCLTSTTLNSGELYDPATGTWTTTLAMVTARYNHTATLLPNGTVLVAGGCCPPSGVIVGIAGAELYTPLTKTATLFLTVDSPACADTNARLLEEVTMTRQLRERAWKRNSMAVIAGAAMMLMAQGVPAAAAVSAPAPGSTTPSLVALSAPHAQLRRLVTAGALNTGTSSGVAASAPNTWSPTGAMTTLRLWHTATPLRNGKVLVAGGCSAVQGGNVCLSTLASAELYDPATGTWAPTGSMISPRFDHTATLLQNGKVLAAGGAASGTGTGTELYDPATGTWTATGNMLQNILQQTATLLPNGRVLVAGGYNQINAVTTAELYDPTTGTWSLTGRMQVGRVGHAATLLPNGQVLVAGGYNLTTNFASAELYNPAGGTWTLTGSMHDRRGNLTATLLPSGRVLAAGGYDNYNPVASGELYDPNTGTWTLSGSMVTARFIHTATLLRNGQVLVAGGCCDSAGYALASAELYNPATGAWVATGAMASGRYYHTATLLSNGRNLVAGGCGGYACAGAELYTPGRGPLVQVTPLSLAFGYHLAGTVSVQPITITNAGTAALVVGSVAITGASAAAFTDTTTCTGAPIAPGGSCRIAVHFIPTAVMSDSASVRIDDNAPTSPQGVSLSGFGYGPNTWAPTGAMVIVRSGHTATLLPSGQVLVAGGCCDSSGNNLAGAELYDPVSGVWALTGAMASARAGHTATLLPDGKVLVAGGCCDSSFRSLASAELYDPATGTWTTTGAMTMGRDSDTATLLPNGRVLVVGGNGGTTSAEMYDPATATWTATGAMIVPRHGHTATLLPGGQVLVGGGCTCTIAELYDPATGTWSLTGYMTAARASDMATLLPTGQVLVAGGCSDGCPQSSAELYDPGTGTWRPTGAMITARNFGFTATLLPNEQVLVTGGCCDSAGNVLAGAELYDPGTGTWTLTGSMTSDRYDHTATLLPSGNVLVAGGCSFMGCPVSSAELYRPALLGVSPISGTVGQSIRLRGTNYFAHEQVQMYWNVTGTVPLATAATDVAGTFAATATVPAAGAGTYTLLAVGTSSGAVARTFFQVISK